ncbi:MAG: inorganic phosphate transporter [Chloroflexi bacterium]|nr:inorganic phosphate transporter [Chloroflexota bacterium]
MPQASDQGFIATLFSPPVLLTFIVCAALAGVIIWLLISWQRRQRRTALAEQREHQESAIERLIDSVADDKEQLVREYEERIRERDQRVSALESEVGRLRDRLSSSGVLGLFGGRQRDVVSALLLENEQLHELLATKQGQLRDMVADMSAKLMDALDQQADDNARAIRYKQALLSAFLQQQEARELINRLVAEGKLTQHGPDETPKLPSAS